MAERVALYMLLDDILSCDVGVTVRYVDTLVVGVSALSVNRVIVVVTVDDAQYNDDVVLDVLGVIVVEGVIDIIDGDRDGLADDDSVCI